jgi:saccharopine dehydrogenase-like NADP-dependent oxidoreductase
MTVVAVLGAGTIAPAVVRDLAESQEIVALRVLDLDGDRAAEVATAQGLGKASSLAVDARRDLAPALESCDLLVNCASYRVNLEAMEACLGVGCHYLDLGGLYWMTDRQLALHDRFVEAELLALLGMGSSPGKTNVMALRAARELDDIDELHVSAAGRDFNAPPGFSVPYALRTLVDEVTMSPVAIREGEVVELEPLTPGGCVDFGYPIGEGETIYTLHSELRTFCESFGCREASFRLSLPNSLLERLRDLAVASSEQIDLAAAETQPPSPRTVSAHVVTAVGGGRQVKVTAVTRPIEGWGLGGSVVSTGAPAAAAVRLIARGRIDAKGALPPERCVNPDDLFAELEQRGTEFRIEFAHAPRTLVK